VRIMRHKTWPRNAEGVRAPSKEKETRPRERESEKREKGVGAARASFGFGCSAWCCRCHVMPATSSASNKESALRVRSIFVLHLIDKALYFFLLLFLSASSKRKTLGARNNKCAQSRPANARLALAAESGTKPKSKLSLLSLMCRHHAHSRITRTFPRPPARPLVLIALHSLHEKRRERKIHSSISAR
jgi:hypothetical protein